MQMSAMLVEQMYPQQMIQGDALFDPVAIEVRTCPKGSLYFR